MLSAGLEVPIWILVIVALLIVVLVAIIWSLKVRPDPSYRIEAREPLSELVQSLVGLSHGELLPGNAVEIVENGEFFDSLAADIAAAASTVHFETFLWKNGEAGRRLAEALAERARAGLEVRVLLDANGSRGAGPETRRVLESSGCHLADFHPGGLRAMGRLNNRDHRKLAVIDGKLAYVGGHCVVDTWLGNAEDPEHFRDVSVRLRGPVVHAIQATFSENWVAMTGELFTGEGVFPQLENVGESPIHVARLRLAGSASAVKILHHLLLCCAEKSIWIQNPYFLPDTDARGLFRDAVARGVDVRVMVPATRVSDMPIVQHAAHVNYDELLKSGVRIFEYQKTLLHQKLIAVDGTWCAIGSTNFDDRSFEINDEITLGILDAGIAKRFEEIFERDLSDCVEVELAQWSKRSVRHRLMDRALFLVKEQL